MRISCAGLSWRSTSVSASQRTNCLISTAWPRARVVAGMAQHLLLRHPEKGGDLHRLEDLHLSLALEHAGNRRRGETQLTREVGLRRAGPFERLLKPGRVHCLHLS